MELRTCRQCGGKFDAGALSHRGPVAIYCSPGCRAKSVRDRRRRKIAPDPVKQLAGQIAGAVRWGHPPEDIEKLRVQLKQLLRDSM